MTTLTLILEGQIIAGQENAFQSMMETLIPAVSQEEGTLDYRGFGNDAGLVMLETYASSEALLTHMANPPVAESLGKFPELFNVSRLVVCGEPSAEVQSAFAGWPVEYCAPHGGVSRLVPITA